MNLHHGQVLAPYHKGGQVARGSRSLFSRLFFINQLLQKSGVIESIWQIKILNSYFTSIFC